MMAPMIAVQDGVRENVATATAPAAAPDAASDATLELLSTIAHEIRSPLSALSASAEMLQSAGADEQARFAEIIRRQAMRLDAIVDGLLETYRAGNGGLRKIRDIVDMRELLEEMCADQHLLYPHHEFAVVAAPGRVAVQRKALSMILSNLLTNSAKYSPPGSTVRIEFARDGFGSFVRVTDEGPGVPEALRKSMFAAGNRAGRTKDDGFGLGLFIARRLCDAIGATIDIEETGSGPGASFVVRLPA